LTVYSTTPEAQRASQTIVNEVVDEFFTACGDLTAKPGTGAPGGCPAPSPWADKVARETLGRFALQKSKTFFLPILPGKPIKLAGQSTTTHHEPETLPFLSVQFRRQLFAFGVGGRGPRFCPPLCGGRRSPGHLADLVSNLPGPTPTHRRMGARLRGFYVARNRFLRALSERPPLVRRVGSRVALRG